MAQVDSGLPDTPTTPQASGEKAIALTGKSAEALRSQIARLETKFADKGFRISTTTYSEDGTRCVIKLSQIHLDPNPTPRERLASGRNEATSVEKKPEQRIIAPGIRVRRRSSSDSRRDDGFFLTHSTLRMRASSSETMQLQLATFEDGCRARSIKLGKKTITEDGEGLKATVAMQLPWSTVLRQLSGLLRTLQQNGKFFLEKTVLHDDINAMFQAVLPRMQRLCTVFQCAGSPVSKLTAPMASIRTLVDLEERIVACNSGISGLMPVFQSLVEDSLLHQARKTFLRDQVALTEVIREISRSTGSLYKKMKTITERRELMNDSEEIPGQIKSPTLAANGDTYLTPRSSSSIWSDDDLTRTPPFLTCDSLDSEDLDDDSEDEEDGVPEFER